MRWVHADASRGERLHRQLERGAVAAVAALLLHGAVGIAAAGQGALLLALLALLLAHPAADLVSGAVHWSADRLLSEHLPWLGPHFVRPFREHHADPRAIVDHDFVETNGNTCIVLAPFLASVELLLPPAAAGSAACFLRAFALALALWLFLTNEFHKWAHDGRRAGFVAWLQRHRLVLAPAHHAVHHRPPHDRRFCITSGWCNAPVDALSRRLRRGITRRRLARAGRSPGAGAS